MSFIRGLECKECGTDYPVEPRMMCDACFGPVEVAYDYDAMKGVVTRESIEAGPRSLWRYRDLLPGDGEPVAGLRSGFTRAGFERFQPQKPDTIARSIAIGNPADGP